jgi:competence protein ComEC
MNRREEDQWHNPSGCMLIGVLAVYLVAQAEWLRNWQTYCTLLWLLPSAAYLLRKDPNALRRLLYTSLGIVAATISICIRNDYAWPTSQPAREFHGEIKIQQIFQQSKASPTISGIAELVTEQHPVWQSLHGSRTLFHLELPLAKRVPVTGEILQVQGVLRPRQTSEALPSGFDEYLDRQGVISRLHQGYFLEIPDKSPLLLAIRQWGYDHLVHSLQEGGHHRPREQSVYLAMLTGARKYLSAQDIDLFTRSGTMHLFAISGLHIVIVSSGVFVVLRLLRLSTLLQSIIGISVIGYYVWITGAAPSAVRAWAAVAIYWCGYALQRKPTPFRVLCTTAVIALLLDPSLIHHAGFQLSYAVVASLLLWGIPILHWLPLEQCLWRHIPWTVLHPSQRLLRRAVRTIWNTWIISVAATLGSAPLIAAGFQLVTPGGAWINLPASLIAAGVIFAAMVSFFGHLIGLHILSDFFNQSALLYLSLLLLWVEQLVDTPGFVQSLYDPPTTSQATLITVVGILLLLVARHPQSWLHKALLICYPIWIVAGMSML